DEAPSPRHQAYPEDGAPSRTALFRRDCHLPVAHDAHAHLRSSEQATAGEMGPADAGGQDNGPRDEGSTAVGAWREGANTEPGADAQTSGGQATAGEMNDEGANDDDANGGHEIDFATPRDEANEETAANGSHREDHRGGSPAYRRELPMSDGEANAPASSRCWSSKRRRIQSADAGGATGTLAAGRAGGSGRGAGTLSAVQSRPRAPRKSISERSGRSTATRGADDAHLPGATGGTGGSHSEERTGMHAGERRGSRSASRTAECRPSGEGESAPATEPNLVGGAGGTSHAPVIC
ncbi:unnamed protein product, partial [Closterium sp. NIES-54]